VSLTRRLYRGALRSSRPRFGAPVHPVVQDPSGRTGGFGFNVRGRCVGRRLLGGKHHRRGAVSRRLWGDRRRLRAAVPPMACEAIPEYTRCRQKTLECKKAEPARTVYTVRTASPSRQRGNGILRRVALSAFDQGLVENPITKVGEAAPSSYLPPSLAYAGSVCGRHCTGTALSSPSAALCYERTLAGRSIGAARPLPRIGS
jgi:hypothetical protein